MTPVFSLLAANAAVTAIIGSPPAMRCYGAGSIPETGVVNANIPCVTQQVVSGLPQNMLARAPNVDYTLVQVDVWELTQVKARQLMELVRDTLEDGGRNTMRTVPMDSYEIETKRYRWLMEFEFWIDR